MKIEANLKKPEYHYRSHQPSFALSRQESKITTTEIYSNETQMHRVDCRRCLLPKLRAVWSTQLIRHRYSDFPSLLTRSLRHMQCKRNSRKKQIEIELIQTQNDRFGSMSWFPAEHTIDMGRMRVKWQMVWRWVEKKQFDWINNNNNNFECLSDALYVNLLWEARVWLLISTNFLIN